MERIVEAQGGDPAVLEDPARLPQAPVRMEVTAERAGAVSAVDARAIGEAAVRLGAGRATRESRIDAAVGFLVDVRPGECVEAGQRLAEVLAASEDAAREAAGAIRLAIHIADSPGPPPLPLVSHRITAAGVEVLAPDGG